LKKRKKNTNQLQSAMESREKLSISSRSLMKSRLRQSGSRGHHCSYLLELGPERPKLS
jgi:hypothetical protein